MVSFGESNFARNTFISRCALGFLLLPLIRYHLPTLDLLSLIKTLRSHGTHTLAHHRNKNPFCTFCSVSVLCVYVCLFSLAAICRSVVELRIVTHIVLLYFRFKCVTESATFALVVAMLLSWRNHAAAKKWERKEKHHHNAL